jgi:hypothetical protein
MALFPPSGPDSPQTLEAAKWACVAKPGSGHDAAGEGEEADPVVEYEVLYANAKEAGGGFLVHDALSDTFWRLADVYGPAVAAAAEAGQGLAEVPADDGQVYSTLAVRASWLEARAALQRAWLASNVEEDGQGGALGVEEGAPLAASELLGFQAPAGDAEAGAGAAAWLAGPPQHDGGVGALSAKLAAQGLGQGGAGPGAVSVAVVEDEEDVDELLRLCGCA